MFFVMLQNVIIWLSEYPDCAIDDKLLKELTDILSNANGKLQVQKLSLGQTKLSDKGVADLFKRASTAFTALMLKRNFPLVRLT